MWLHLPLDIDKKLYQRKRTRRIRCILPCLNIRLDVDAIEIQIRLFFTYNHFEREVHHHFFLIIVFHIERHNDDITRLRVTLLRSLLCIRITKF